MSASTAESSIATHAYRATKNPVEDRLNLDIKQALLEMKQLFLTAPFLMGRLPPDYAHIKAELKKVKRKLADGSVGGVTYILRLRQLRSQAQHQVDFLRELVPRRG